MIAVTILRNGPTQGPAGRQTAASDMLLKVPRRLDLERRPDLKGKSIETVRRILRREARAQTSKNL